MCALICLITLANSWFPFNGTGVSGVRAGRACASGERTGRLAEDRSTEKSEAGDANYPTKDGEASEVTRAKRS